MKKLMIVIFFSLITNSLFASHILDEETKIKMMETMEFIIDHTVEGNREDVVIQDFDKVESCYIVGVKEGYLNKLTPELQELVDTDPIAKRIYEDDLFPKVEEVITHQYFIVLTLQEEGNCLVNDVSYVEGGTSGFSYFTTVQEIFTKKELENLPFSFCK